MRNKQSQKTEYEILSQNVKLIPKLPKCKMTTTSVSISEELLREFNYIVNKKYGFGPNIENNERAGRRRGTKSSSAVIAELVEEYVVENKKLLHGFIPTTTTSPSEPQQEQESQQ